MTKAEAGQGGPDQPPGPAIAEDAYWRDLATLGAVIVRLEHELARARGAGMMAPAADTDVVRIKSDLDLCERTLRQVMNDRDEANAALRRMMQIDASKTQQIEALIHQRDGALRMIDELLTSRSWRVTAPLRRIAALMRRKA
ncbi:MAG: hypothetical protein Q4G25_06850 [Paracoccus sp. (in: a-proteobacteria)]|nr:hypothetical protein [Paracoccus sp. (in: a-proteobacteria)]